MKVLAIKNEYKQAIGYLFCYVKSQKYIIELNEGIKDMEVPLILDKFAREKTYTVPSFASGIFVRQRVIPRDRQNIAYILKNANLKVYDELKLLILSKEKCSHDDFYVEQIDYEDVSIDIKARKENKLEEAYLVNTDFIVLMYYNKEYKKIKVSELNKPQLLNNINLLMGLSLEVGGNGITFNDAMTITLDELNKLPSYPIDSNDIKAYAANNLISSSRAGYLMQCSRQNISYLVKVNKLIPVIQGLNETYFTKGNVKRVMTE